VSVADAATATKPASEFLDIKAETEPVDVTRTLNYGQVLDVRAHLLAGTATSEERLVALHTLTQCDVYMKKVLLARYEQRLMPSDVNPNNFMLVGRMLAAPESGFAAWAAKCDLYYYELRQLLELINASHATRAARQAADARQPHRATLSRDFSPLAGWSNEPPPNKIVAQQAHDRMASNRLSSICEHTQEIMRTKMTAVVTR
jgi:hypothetical protein